MTLTESDVTKHALRAAVAQVDFHCKIDFLKIFIWFTLKGLFDHWVEQHSPNSTEHLG